MRTIPALGLFLALIALASCESVLFIELEESDRLIVVNGVLTDASTAEVQVSRTRHILDNAPLVPLEDAEVRLYREGILVDRLVYMDNGYYRSDHFIPAIGETYLIEVDHQGYPSVSAQSSIPPTVGIAQIDTSTVVEEFNDYGWTYTESVLQFDLTLQDPGEEDNYYLLGMKADRSYADYRDTTVNYIDSLFYNGEWHYFVSDSTYFLEDIHRFTDQPYLNSSDLIIEAITDQGILFSDQLIDGKSYSLRFSVSTYSLESADSAVVDIQLHSISESYYKYLKSRQKHYNTSDNYLAVPVIVYSNVNEGTGYLGGYSTDTRTLVTYIQSYRYEWWYYE